jgi:hypothetical protein
MLHFEKVQETQQRRDLLRCCTLKTRNPLEEGMSGHFEEMERNMSTNATADRRRFGVIETRYRQHGKIAMYNLTINGKLWACVEWSATRRAWCVQDASGRCLAHCDAIHGEHIDAQTAIRLAKRMIVDGRMPTPEEGQQQLEERLRRDQLGEPMEILEDDRVILVGKQPTENAP